MITKYNLMLDEANNRHPYLLKEASLDCSSECLDSPDAIADMLHTCFHLGERAEEYVFLIAVDAGMSPLGVFELSHGTVRESPVGMRELFIRVLLCGGAGFVLAHNHPGNSRQPSEEDHRVCRRIKEVSALMGVPMLDFIIIGSGCHLSFSREDLL